MILTKVDKQQLHTLCRDRRMAFAKNHGAKASADAIEPNSFLGHSTGYGPKTTVGSICIVCICSWKVDWRHLAQAVVGLQSPLQPSNVWKAYHGIVQCRDWRFLLPWPLPTERTSFLAIETPDTNWLLHMIQNNVHNVSLQCTNCIPFSVPIVPLQCTKCTPLVYQLYPLSVPLYCTTSPLYQTDCTSSKKKTTNFTKNTTNFTKNTTNFTKNTTSCLVHSSGYRVQCTGCSGTVQWYSALVQCSGTVQ